MSIAFHASSRMGGPIPRGRYLFMETVAPDVNAERFLSHMFREELHKSAAAAAHVQDRFYLPKRVPYLLFYFLEFHVLIFLNSL